jgi:chlorite dismutase
MREVDVTGSGVNSRMFSFVGGNVGDWRVLSATAVAGQALPDVAHVDIVAGAAPVMSPPPTWVLRGVTSHERYVTRAEKTSLVDRQAVLGRPQATHAALIPIRKSAAWWALTQDERRAVFEDRSRHIAIGLHALPGVARRLHHCRDLAEPEAFDFVTLFDYAETDAPVFDQMLAQLRATEEWTFVEREVDIRLVRVA